MAGPAATDFIDYIFQFPDQGAFQRAQTVGTGTGSTSGFVLIDFGVPILVQKQTTSPTIIPGVGVPLLIYNPVENLTFRAAQRNTLVFPPQQANSVVALSGFWVMVTLKGFPGPDGLPQHPNLIITNDRTLMFARQPSVISTKIDVSHINIVINIFGVYVADGLQMISGGQGLLLEDGVSNLLLEDATSTLQLEGS